MTRPGSSRGLAAGDGQHVVETRCVDILDSATRELHSSSTDDIACRFLDTAYDGESFFVRHPCYPGADDPYDRFRRALRADISEGAWASIRSTVLRPFARPSTGRIAVKAINHYGVW